MHENWSWLPTYITSAYLRLRTGVMGCYEIPKLLLSSRKTTSRILNGLTLLLGQIYNNDNIRLCLYLRDSFLEFINQAIDMSESYCKEYEFYDGISDILYDNHV